LANAFIKQYQYNLDMAPIRTQLQNITQMKGESFKVYAQRWRELAAQVRPPLLESELVDIFTNTLQVRHSLLNHSLKIVEDITLLFSLKVITFFSGQTHHKQRYLT
jgi:hypothetical protein